MDQKLHLECEQLRSGVLIFKHGVQKVLAVIINIGLLCKQHCQGNSLPLPCPCAASSERGSVRGSVRRHGCWGAKHQPGGSSSAPCTLGTLETLSRVTRVTLDTLGTAQGLCQAIHYVLA